MTDEEYELVEATPSPDDYRRLRIAAGLSPKSAEAAAAGLPNTIYAVIIRKDGEAIGMGRIIGDRGLFYQIVDIAVDPKHQKRGLGKRIVGALVDHLQEIALPGAYISLIADGDAHHLYSLYGFRPTAPRSIGMYLHFK
jgi:ribosomal protein S18 acetylase RimI-like enzyme